MVSSKALLLSALVASGVYGRALHYVLPESEPALEVKEMEKRMALGEMKVCVPLFYISLFHFSVDDPSRELFRHLLPMDYQQWRPTSLLAYVVSPLPAALTPSLLQSFAHHPPIASVI